MLSSLLVRLLIAAFLVPGAALASEPYIEVEEIADGFRHTTPVDWLEVEGYVWTGESPYLDVMIAIDLSFSTLLASGADIDGDGKVGRPHPNAPNYFMAGVSSTHYTPRLFSSDSGDTVARAELLAARRFVEGVDFERTRVGIVTFGKGVRLRIPLQDAPGPLLDTIASIVREETRRMRDYGGEGTPISRALAVAGVALLEGSTDGVPRRREVLLLSDGMPTHPKPTPARHVVATALVLQDYDVAAHFFPLGPIAQLNAPYFEFIDEVAGTRHTKVVRAGDIVEKLPEVRLDRIRELEVENRSTRQPGRALRLFADGSFDAIVPLAPGANLIAFRALTTDDQSVEVLRTVEYTPSPADSPEGARLQREALEAFALRLEQRRAETELVIDIEAARDRALERERRLRIEVEGPAAP